MTAKALPNLEGKGGVDGGVGGREGLTESWKAKAEEMVGSVGEKALPNLGRQRRRRGGGSVDEYALLT